MAEGRLIEQLVNEWLKDGTRGFKNGGVKDKIREAVKGKFLGKLFSLKDIAAWVGCSEYWAGQVVEEMPGVRLVGRERSEQTRGGMVRLRKVYLFEGDK